MKNAVIYEFRMILPSDPLSVKRSMIAASCRLSLQYFSKVENASAFSAKSVFFPKTGSVELGESAAIDWLDGPDRQDGQDSVS